MKQQILIRQLFKNQAFTYYVENINLRLLCYKIILVLTFFQLICFVENCQVILMIIFSYIDKYVFNKIIPVNYSSVFCTSIISHKYGC